jgi:hypothetical protein
MKKITYITPKRYYNIKDPSLSINVRILPWNRISNHHGNGFGSNDRFRILNCPGAKKLVQENVFHSGHDPA